MPSILVTGRGSRITTRNRQHAEAKLAKLEKYFDGIGKIEAILAEEGDGAEVELVITVRKGNPVVCHSHSKDLYAALDLALDKAEAQLTKRKERTKQHRSDRLSTAEADSAAVAGEGRDEDDGLESYDEIIEKRDFS